MQTECSANEVGFGRAGGRQVIADFDGGMPERRVVTVRKRANRVMDQRTWRPHRRRSPAARTAIRHTFCDRASERLHFLWLVAGELPELPSVQLRGSLLTRRTFPAVDARQSRSMRAGVDLLEPGGPMITNDSLGFSPKFTSLGAGSWDAGGRYSTLPPKPGAAAAAAVWAFPS
jgi:hypothetical protein